MFRFLPLFLALAILACGSPELTPGTARGTLDSQLVVTTLSEVPDTRPAVAFLGTSLTAGLGLVQREDSYVARVAALAGTPGPHSGAFKQGWAAARGQPEEAIGSRIVVISMAHLEAQAPDSVSVSNLTLAAPPYV